MTSENKSVSEQNSVLQQVIADYLLAESSGRPVDRTQWLRRHPELMDELQVFFADHDQVRAWAEPMCVAAPVTPSPAGNEQTLDASEGTPIASTALPGRRLGDYEIIEEIARGGMGVVFKARQVSLNRVVALKMILAGELAGAANIQRFQSEARAAAHLDHPNIVPIYEVGEQEGRHFFSMKLVEGGSLSSKGGQPSANAGAARAAVRLMAIVARAVHYAHQRGILHRDLKPANILLDHAGQPLVTDFGLAKRLADSSQVTQSGAIVGTPSYMAPEQAAGKAALSTAADVYSLGAILFELLTGQVPFRADSALEVLRQVIDAEPPRLRSLNPHIHRDLEIICLKCLEKDPQRRYGSAEMLAEDLERWLADEPIRARAATTWEQVTKWTKRRPAMAGLIAVSVLAPFVALIVGVIYDADLQIALKNANDLTDKLGKEESKAKNATRQAEIDAKQAGEANQNAQKAKKRADQLLKEAEGLRLIADSRVVLPDQPALGLLLAIEGARRGSRHAAHNNALAAAWSACRERGPVLRGEEATSIISAAFFPDGKRVLTTTSQSVCIVERATGKLLARQLAPIPITSSRISPDGRYVVVTCRDYSLASYSDGRRILHTDRVVHLWDVTTDQLVILKGHENRVIGVSFSPDSKRLLTASWDHTARIWDTASGATIHVLKGHTCPLESARFGPDGKTVFAASTGSGDFSTVPAREFKDATDVDVPIAAKARMLGSHGSSTGAGGSTRGGDLALIWDADTGKELKVIPASQPRWAVYGPPRAALSPTGEHLIASQGKAFIVDLKTGIEKSLEVPSPAFAPVFSPDGKYFLTYTPSSAPAVCVWETATGKKAASVFGHGQAITSIRFIDNQRFLTTSKDQTCRIFSFSAKALPPTKELMVLKGHELEVFAADISPDGATLLTASADGTARFWDIREPDELGQPLPNHEKIWSAATSPDGKWAAIGCFDGGVWLVDVKTRAPRSAWPADLKTRQELMRKGLLGEVTTMSFSADGKKLLTVSADPVGYLQDLMAKKKTPVPEPYTPVRIWDVDTGKELGLQGGHEAGVNSASFSPDGKRVLTVADARHAVRFFNDKTGVRIGAGSQSSDKDRTARVWDSATGKELFVLQGKWREIGVAVWNNDGKRIATTHEDAVRIWDAVNGAELMQLGKTHRITSALFSADGTRLFTWEDRGLAHRGSGHWNALPRKIDGQADLWDAVTGQHVATLTGHQAPINSAAFSRHGQLLVTAAEEPNKFSSSNPLGLHGRHEDTNFRDRTARIWDAVTGKPLQVLRGHLRSVHSASFSHDGKWLVTTSEDRTARLWDLSTGKEFFTLAGHRDAVKTAEFTSDGRFVLTTSWDGAARIWPTDPLPLAVSRQPRELTAEERERFEVAHRK